MEVTPAEVSETLLRSEDADVALQGFVEFLQDKKKQGRRRFFLEEQAKRPAPSLIKDEAENVGIKNQYGCLLISILLAILVVISIFRAYW